MNGRPSCWKISSWPNWKLSIVSYSPCPLPAHVPSSQASRAQLGWMFVGNLERHSGQRSWESVGFIFFRMRESVISASTPTPSTAAASTTT